MVEGRRSFEEMTVSELRVVANEFAVDLTDKSKKAEIIGALQEDGVTFQMYKKLIAPEIQESPTELDSEPIEPVEETDPVAVAVGDDPDDDPQTFVVKMTRKNHTFQIRGYHFSQVNPFALVTESDADYLVETGGFRMASPKELKDFYGQS